jgi:hypothetical protein
MPQPSSILGYTNVTEALTIHKTFNNKNKSSKRSRLSGTEADSGPDPDPDSDTTAFNFVNFLQIFNDTNNRSGNDEDVGKSCNDSSGIGGEADDEEDDECVGRSSVHDSPISHAHKPGERYTGFHFAFLKEEWLEPENGSLGDSSEEFSSSTNSD